MENEPSLFELVGDTLRSRNRPWVLLTWFFNLVFFVLMIVCAVQFAQCDTTPEMLFWALGINFCLLTVMMLKIWYWMELNKQALRREIRALAASRSSP